MARERDVHVTVRLTRLERVALEQLATGTRRSVSRVLREALGREARDLLTTPPEATGAASEDGDGR
jgi:predicted transcriptional regulator